MASCTVEGCVKPHNAKGYCREHYARWRQHGDPLTRVRRVKGTGSIVDGYLFITVDGKQVRAHRVIAGASPDQHVHHLDGDRLNNDPGNLTLMSPGDHHRTHDAQHFTSETGRAAALRRWRR